jgi:hypothetical protein
MGCEYTAAVLHLIPNFKAGSPFTLGVYFGGPYLGASLQAFGSACGATAARLGTEGTKAVTKAGYDRRGDEWAHQKNLAVKELTQVDKQIAAAQIRQAIAEKELANHDLQLENAQKVDEFMRDKYTNQELYNWMIGQIASVYFQSYQLAYDVAKKAERAFRRELGLKDSSFIELGYWDSLKKVMAAERLYHDLKRMEVAYLDQNKREHEITKHVSLLQVNPMALIRLRQTGRCMLSVPEELFDLDCPGHYM